MIAVLALAGSTHRTEARVISQDEALNMAKNWITQVVHRKGSWGGSPSPSVGSVQGFKRSGRLVGYYCQVDPHGYVIIPLVEGLAPIKTYSVSDDLDPALEEGPAGVLKARMERILDGIERKLGPLDQVRTEDLVRLDRLDHWSRWEKLAVRHETFLPWDEAGALKGAYQYGDTLVAARWHQGDPYYNDCPEPTNDCENPHCSVGCVATAGAQIIHYWAWPAYFPLYLTHDWANIPTRALPTSPPEVKSATAFLNYQIGNYLGSGYCESENNDCGTSAATADMETVYESHGYHPECYVSDRRLWYSDEEWWDILRFDIVAFRPVQYRIEGHSIVCDGVDYGYMVHMNYGWDNGWNTWFAIDNLHYVVDDPSPADDYVVRLIRPFHYTGPTMPAIVGDDTFFYFAQDCSNPIPLQFNTGSHLQLRHDVIISCANYHIKFPSTEAKPTYIFTRGDRTKGIKLRGGTLKLREGGELTVVANDYH